MRQSQGPFEGEPIATASLRPDPTNDSDEPPNSSNEDFLFHLYRGSELLQDNRVHEAKEELERAIQLQPKDSKGQDLLAVVYFRLGLYARAIQIYEQLRRRNKADTALLLNLALCYLKTGQFELARRDLEQLLVLSPTHSRAWGYLGLACERMGDLEQAEYAFKQGGHGPMAKRIASRREPPGASDALPSRSSRDAGGALHRELDAGGLSFALENSAAEQLPPHAPAPGLGGQDLALRKTEYAAERPETAKPNTRDGATLDAADGSIGVPSLPQLGLPPVNNRRPTLIAPVGAPPMHDVPAPEIAAVLRIPSQKPPSITLEHLGSQPPSLRRPVVAVPSPFGPSKAHEPSNQTEAVRTRTLPPVDASVPPAPLRAKPARAEFLRFPEGSLVLHGSGVALVSTTSDRGFATRLESIRVQQSGLRVERLERRVKGKPNGEAFGGVTSPMVLATGEGQLVLAPRPGRKLTDYTVGDGEMFFAREDILLGFSETLSFENGRLATGENEHVPIVQLRGDGRVLIETIGDVLPLAIQAGRSLSVRREVVLGWFGHLVPHAVAAADAPCGQRGLVTFAGNGRILVASI